MKHTVDLSSLSDDDLHAEIGRRAARPTQPPPPLSDPDFKPLVKMIVKGVTQAVRDKLWPKDFPAYVYEAALEAVYGPEFWTWRNTFPS